MLYNFKHNNQERKTLHTYLLVLKINGSLLQVPTDIRWRAHGVDEEIMTDREEMWRASDENIRLTNLNFTWYKNNEAKKLWDLLVIGKLTTIGSLIIFIFTY